MVWVELNPFHLSSLCIFHKALTCLVSDNDSPGMTAIRQHQIVLQCSFGFMVQGFEISAYKKSKIMEVNGMYFVLSNRT